MEPFYEPSNEHAAPTELENDQGALAAIDMALLRSFSNRFMVPIHAQKRNKPFYEPQVGGCDCPLSVEILAGVQCGPLPKERENVRPRIKREGQRFGIGTVQDEPKAPSPLRFAAHSK
jgi:hypothetical protein